MAKVRYLFLFSILFAFFDCPAQSDRYTLRHSIYFQGGRYNISEDQLQRVYFLVDSLFENGQFELTIHSHTDNIGGVEYNQWLSERRSEQTVYELDEYGIDPASMHIKDFGQHNPLYDNSTHEGRLLNRRVDIIFWPLSL